jgi:hypothetical protein
MDEAHITVVTFDPHVTNALILIGAGLLILLLLKFVDFIGRKAKQR